MLVVHVHVHIKPESVEVFKAATLANARESLKEPGIARFDVDGDDRSGHRRKQVPAADIVGRRRNPRIDHGQPRRRSVVEHRAQIFVGGDGRSIAPAIHLPPGPTG